MHKKILLEGIFLFLFIPFTLYLLLTFPFGISLSLLFSMIIIATNKFISRPYMKKYRSFKCLWCNKLIYSESGKLDILENKIPIEFYYCSSKCKNELINFFAFTNKYGILIKLAILTPLVIYFLVSFLIDFSLIKWNILNIRYFFKGVISVVVILVSLLYKIKVKGIKLSFPFPIHNIFLLSINNTLWIFRIVGIWWIWNIIRPLIRI